MSLGSFRHFLRYALSLVLLLGSVSLYASGPGNDRMTNWWHAGTNSGTLFATLENQGLWKTTDAGTTWTQVGQTLGGYVNSVYFSSAAPQAVCAAKDGVPYLSLDGGTTWQLNSWAVAAIGNGYVNWLSGQNNNAGLRLAVVDRKKVYQAIVTLGGDPLSVTNMAVSDISAGLPAAIVINAPVRVDSSGNMLLATNQGVFRRANNASTWTAINNGLGSDLDVMEARPYGDALVAITERNAWRSLDSGANWTNVSNGLPAAPGKMWSLSDGTANSGVYITIPGFGVYKSADGNSWTQFSQAVPGETLGNIAIIGTGAGSKLIGATARGLYVAADASSAWQPAGGFAPSNGCTGEPSLLASIQGALDSYSSNALSNLNAFISPNYFDSGRNATAELASVQADRAENPTNISIKLINPKCTIAADGVHAVVADIGRMYGRNNDETGLLYVMHDDTDSWNMVKEGGQWKSYGNRLPFDMWTNAGVTTDANGNPMSGRTPWISFGMPDDAASYAAVTVAGPGISGTASLTFDANSHQWQSWSSSGPGANAQFSGTADPTNGGANPLTYTVTVTPKSGSAMTAQVVVSGPFMSLGAQLLKPRNFGAQKQFAVLMPNSANYAYGFELRNSQNNMIAANWDIPAPVWSPPQVATGAYTLSTYVRRKAGAVEYLSQAENQVCFDGSQWLLGTCTGGGTGTFSHANYREAFIAANRDTAIASSGTTNYSVSVAYPRASNDQLASYALSCPGYASVTGTLPSASSGDTWTTHLNFGATKPSLPITCTSTLTSSSGQTNSKSLTIDHFNESYPLNPAVSPTMNGTNTPPVLDCRDSANVPVVTWTNPASGLTYQMSIVSADYSNHTWVGDNLTSPVNLGTVTQNLTPGASYKNLLASDESVNGNIYAAQLHLPFSCASAGGGTTTTTTSSTTTTTSSTTTTTLAGSATTIHFVQGWNLAGNGTTGSIDVATAFGNQNVVSTVWKWLTSAAKWAFFAPSMSAQDLASYATAHGYEVLTTIGSGDGFWVNARSAFDVQISVPGLLGSSVYRNEPETGTGRVLPGWNLLATGDSTTAVEFNKIMSGVPPAQGVIPRNVSTLWAWKADTRQWYFYAPSLHIDGTLDAYATGQGYLGFGTTTLGPTTGFWVKRP